MILPNQFASLLTDGTLKCLGGGSACELRGSRGVISFQCLGLFHPS